jgi:Pyridoxamine 5'-phosphate oxidase
VSETKVQRRGRRIAMTPEEVDAFLAAERTCRVATGSPSGPHLTALWFAWSAGSLWLYSIVNSQRWTDLNRDGRIAILVDAGEDYFELRGVEIQGTAAVVGEVPRTGADVPELVEAERTFAAKYFGAGPAPDQKMYHDGRHAWLRVTPEKITSWDFRKLPAPTP